MAARSCEQEKSFYQTEDKIAQRLPEEYEELVINSQRTIIRMRQQNKYQLESVGSMDETPMNFDMAPSSTVNAIGEKTILIKTTGNEKIYYLW